MTVYNFVYFIFIGNPPPENCARNWEKVGCFHDDIFGKDGRVYPHELVNHRDPLNPSWDGHILDWYAMPQSIHA